MEVEEAEGGQTQNAMQTGGGEIPPTPGEDHARWRQRALELEAQLQDAQAKVAEAQAALEQAREALDASERKRQIERQLTEADAIDLETALMLTEASVGQMKAPDVSAAVADLRRRKPWLFRPRSGASASGALSAASVEPADQAAREAASTGDRRALLRYLRARRAN